VEQAFRPAITAYTAVGFSPLRYSAAEAALGNAFLMQR
jgi:hypothetical protein